LNHQWVLGRAQQKKRLREIPWPLGESGAATREAEELPEFRGQAGQGVVGEVKLRQLQERAAAAFLQYTHDAFIPQDICIRPANRVAITAD